MNVNLTKGEIINLIEATPVSYGKYTKELNEVGHWDFNADGPTHFNWDVIALFEKSEEELYEFYNNLRWGKFYVNVQETTEYKPVELPTLKREFPHIVNGLIVRPFPDLD